MAAESSTAAASVPSEAVPATAAMEGDMSAEHITVEALLAQAKQYIEDCDTEVAFECCQRALDIAPNNVEVVEASAVVATELGLLDEAHELWQRSVELAPDQGYEKYLCLGQLSVGAEALQQFERAVERMQAARNALPADSDEAKLIARQLSSALVSMTEIYLTDCCFESDAEQRCEQYLAQAVQADATNPEVYQTLASVRLSQQQPEKASEALEQSIALWIELDPQEPGYPPYDARIALVKLLLELSRYERALQVLDGLQREDDQSIDMWYLFGWTCYCVGEAADNDEARRLEVWEEARECLLQSQKMYQLLEHDDEGICEHTQELLDTLNSTLPPRAGDDDDEDEAAANGVEEDWEDVASSGDEQDTAMDMEP